MYWLGIDVGGSFTDPVLYDTANAALAALLAVSPLRYGTPGAAASGNAVDA